MSIANFGDWSGNIGFDLGAVAAPFAVYAIGTDGRHDIISAEYDPLEGASEFKIDADRITINRSSALESVGLYRDDKGDIEVTNKYVASEIKTDVLLLNNILIAHVADFYITVDSGTALATYSTVQFSITLSQSFIGNTSESFFETNEIIAPPVSTVPIVWREVTGDNQLGEARFFADQDTSSLAVVYELMNTATIPAGTQLFLGSATVLARTELRTPPDE